LQQQLLMKGCQAMVESAEIAGQNRFLRLHSDQLTRELAQRNRVLNETVTELRAQALRREQAEAALQQAHDELEQRVIDRTEQLYQANLSLARHERLAAQSRMVAGIAHRLNTPLGTARLAVSTVHAASLDFKNQLELAIRREQLVEYINLTLESANLAERSLERASELMHVFKQVSTLEHIEQASMFDPQKLVRDACQMRSAELAKLHIPIHLALSGAGAVSDAEAEAESESGGMLWLSAVADAGIETSDWQCFATRAITKLRGCLG